MFLVAKIQQFKLWQDKHILCVCTNFTEISVQILFPQPIFLSLQTKQPVKNMSISKPQNILSIQSRDEFRQWLMTHHATARECWVKVKRGRPVDDGTFWNIDAVEEAMCFGWIDSTLKRLDGEAYQRFAPRTKGSLWSELNKERCRRMERLGRMTDMGRAVLPDMSPGGFTINEEILSALRQRPHRVAELPELSPFIPTRTH